MVFMIRVSFLAILVSALLGPLSAAADPRTLMDGRFGRLSPRLEAGTIHSGEQAVQSQAAELDSWESRASLLAPLLQNERHELALHLSLDHLRLSTEAALPRSNLAIPQDLWDLGLGATYRHRLENGWIWGLGGTFGSSGDDLFQDSRDLYGRATTVLIVPAEGRDYWAFGLSYATDRGFLRHIPLPIIAYAHNPGPTWGALVGAPFLNVWVRPTDNLTLNLSYLPIFRVRAGATLRLNRNLSLFSRFEWSDSNFFLTARSENNDRLTSERKRLTAGLRIAVGPPFVLELAGGYGFDRRIYLGQDWDDDADGFDVDSGWFVGAMLKFNFGDPGGRR